MKRTPPAVRRGQGKSQIKINCAAPPTTVTSSLQLTAEVERVLDAEALALFASVHDLCGTGVVRDRGWWAVEAARCGTDWPSIMTTVAAIPGTSSGATTNLTTSTSAGQIGRNRMAPNRSVPIRHHPLLGGRS
jgi:hypothetical protein